VKNIVLSPAAYGIDLESVPDEPYFTAVQAPKKIDVKVAAKLAGMSEDQFVALNPAHNKAVASGTGTLIVPVDKADDFRTNLENYNQPLVSWTEYQARRGESLDAIAKKYHSTSAQLKVANGEIKLDKKGHLRAAGPVMVPMKKDPIVAVKVAQASAIHPQETRVAAPVQETAAAKGLHRAFRRHALQHRAASPHDGGCAPRAEQARGRRPHPARPQAAPALASAGR
jgi:membrane-bound lytic murein transglycosylase D